MGKIWRAIIFSLLITLPGISAYLVSDGYSPHVLSEWDESYHLPIIYSAGSVPLSDLWSFEHGIRKSHNLLGDGVPHSVVDGILGHIAVALKIRPPAFQLLCDLVFAFVSYLVFSKFFLEFTSSRLVAESCALAMLFFPWLGAISNWVSIPMPGTIFVTKSYSHPTCQAVIRSFYTQVSYPLFGLTLHCAVRAARQPAEDMKYAFFGGLLGGLLLYLYFFTWVTTIPLVIIFSLFMLFGSDSKLIMHRLKSLSVFCISALIVSIPGIFIIARANLFHRLGAEHPARALSALLRSQWFLSPEKLLVLMMLCWLLSRKSIRGSAILLPSICLCISALSSEIVLVNLQPLLGVSLEPFHFAQFYFDPLLSGFLVFFGMVIFRANRSKLILSGALVATALLFSITKSALAVDGARSDGELISVFRYLREHSKLDSRIMALSFPVPFSGRPESGNFSPFPFWIDIFAERAALSLFLEPNQDDALNIELAMALYYSGRLQPMGYCGDSKGSVENDLIGYTQTIRALARQSACAKLDGIKGSMSLCEFASKVHFDLLIWDNEELTGNPPKFYSERMLKLWSSPNGRFDVYAPMFDDPCAIL